MKHLVLIGMGTAVGLTLMCQSGVFLVTLDNNARDILIFYAAFLPSSLLLGMLAGAFSFRLHLRGTMVALCSALAWFVGYYAILFIWVVPGGTSTPVEEILGLNLRHAVVSIPAALLVVAVVRLLGRTWVKQKS